MGGVSKGMRPEGFPGSWVNRKGFFSRKNTTPITIMKFMRKFIPDLTLPGLKRPALSPMAQGGSVKCAMGRERGEQGGLVSLRIGSVNVTSMRRDGEVVDMAEDVWTFIVCRILDGKVKVQEGWASTSFSGWAV